MIFSRVSQGEHFLSVINNHRLLHEVLTVKDDKDEHFTYGRSKVGLNANIPQYNNDKVNS